MMQPDQTSSPDAALLFETISVSKHYGDYRALHDVSFRLRDGEFISIVGPNGAGKTTIVNVVTGLLKPTVGEVRFMGRDIAGVGPVELARRGMSRAFQLVNIFPALTVRETLAVAVKEVPIEGRIRARVVAGALLRVEAAAAAVIRHPVHVAAGGRVGLRHDAAAVGVRRHAEDVRVHDPLVAVDERVPEPVDAGAWLAAEEEHQVAEQHQPLDVVCVPGLS
jgi:ABC-type sugar transport system ATPase subunit